MSNIPTSRLESFLQERAVPYALLHHRRDFTAQEVAHDTHTPGRRFAKTVVLAVDGDYAMAVLPAHEHVDVELLRVMLGAKSARLAREDEMAWLYPDCELGAEPPFGNLYGQPVCVSLDLLMTDEITFRAGNHEDAIRMRMADFARVTHPRFLDFAA